MDENISVDGKFAGQEWIRVPFYPGSLETVALV